MQLGNNAAFLLYRANLRHKRDKGPRSVGAVVPFELPLGATNHSAPSQEKNSGRWREPWAPRSSHPCVGLS